MVSPLFRRRFFSTNRPQKWSIKQVTKSNFADSIEEIKTHISDSEFVALSLRRTGSAAAPWHRVSAYDTADTAYSKAKYAAERYQVLQFAVCPFTIMASKVIAHPYNFHLFPRDELKMGMPSYGFSCQTSFLELMAQEGFDFNTCIYNGISYLSRTQELSAKARTGNPVLVTQPVKSSSSLSVADGIFIGRIKSRIKHWLESCKDLSTSSEELLLRSLRKLILHSNQYGSRPCMDIDVCSERQALLILETLPEISGGLVPLIVPARGGSTQAVRIILSSSKEDKDILLGELKALEDEQSKKFRGFREVMDLISASQKPAVSHNSLNDFTSIYSMFLTPLPPTMDEFLSSLKPVFPQIIDVNNLVKEEFPQARSTNISTALSYLNTRSFTPTDVEVPSKDIGSEANTQGHDVVSICHLFAKLCSTQKTYSGGKNLGISVPYFTSNIDTRKVDRNDIVFLWGFRQGTSARTLKSKLQGSHDVFSEEDFDVCLVDKSCATVVFWKPDLSKSFLGLISSREISGCLRDLVEEEGLKGSSYEVYKRICEQGLWESELADAFDKATADDEDRLVEAGSSESKKSEVYWDDNNNNNNDLIINYNAL